MLAADNPRHLSQENSSPPIFCAVYRRKTVRRRYPALFIAGKQFADGLNQEKVAGEVLADGLNREKVAGEVLAADYPCGLSQERGSSDEMTARYGGR